MGCCDPLLRLFRPRRSRGDPDSAATDSSRNGNLGGSEDLWQKAYDKVMDENPDLVKQYNTLLVHIAEAPTLDNKGQIQGYQKSPDEETLKHAIEKAQKRVAKSDATIEAAGEIADIVLSCKEFISLALTAIPQVAAVWAGTTLVLQGFSNVATESSVTRKGLLYVASLVRWYCQLFASAAEDKDEKGKQLLAQLRDQFIDLYTKSIEYQMRIVVLYHRNRFVRAMRDSIKIDGWEAALVEIKNHEENLYERLQSYDEFQGLLHLGNIRTGIENSLEFLQFSQNWEISKMIGTFNLEGLDYRRFMDDNPDEEENTCDWVLETDGFRNWTKGLLLLTALPGQGKSVLARYLVKTWEKKSTVCHFFFKDDSLTRKKSSNALCALIHQLLMQHPYIAGIKEVYNEITYSGEGLRTSTRDLWRVLGVVLKHIDGTVTIVLDALDECGDDDDGNRKGLLQCLQEFTTCGMETTNMKILATSRMIHQVTNNINEDLTTFTLLDINQHQKELLPMINKVIDKWMEKFPDWTQELREKVKVELKGDGSQHTYIWLRLIFKVLDSHRTQTLSDDQWLDLIKSASDIDSTYEKLLTQTNPVVVGDAKLFFSLILAAAEPLTVAEINIALSVCKGGDPKGAYMRTVDAMKKWINDNTGFLTTISSEADGGIVQFIHQTAKEYFVNPETQGRWTAGADTGGGNDNSTSPFKRFTTDKDAHVAILEACERCLQDKTQQWKTEKDERRNVDLDDGRQLHIKDLLSDTSLQQGFLDYAPRFYAFHFDKVGAKNQCYLANGCLSYPFGNSAMPSAAPTASIMLTNDSKLLLAVRSQHFAWCRLANMAPQHRRSVHVPEVYCVIRRGDTIFVGTEFISGEIFDDINSELSSRAVPAIECFLSFQIPDDMPLGPLRETDDPLSGVIEHPIFFEGTSENTGVLFRPISGDTIYVVDFQDAAILPLSFMIYALMTNVFGAVVSFYWVNRR
ncbi:ankyrin repeat-containing protein [Colletotrichum kahawae]|uniref:Ankyrin repeat-containing protein n=1 Tax=Colletotrichum kahawae TaxID=34407 RepID=A0AAD9Y6C5_COLKA|nr:ankyrin repeat-containing protein [Colletotrichum kahawae]